MTLASVGNQYYIDNITLCKHNLQHYLKAHSRLYEFSCRLMHSFADTRKISISALMQSIVESADRCFSMNEP